jgi:VWFA-related protein
MRAGIDHERRVHRGTGEDTRRSIIASLLVIVMLCTGVSSQESSGEYTFRSRTELVLVNVTVRDKNGNPVRDLKREDFTVLEDNKPQQVVSFDLENTDAVLSTAATEAALLRPAKPASTDAVSALATRPLKDRRLIILFFDLSSMQPDEIDQATSAAQNYVDKQMVPADLVSVVSLGSTLSVNQDFTSDRARC